MKIGDHVLVDGKSPGTIRYIGLVDGHSGEWLGIEWWRQQGKHNGTFQGKFYFESAGPLSASFIRRERLVCGHSFTEGIRRQYVKSFQREETNVAIDYSLFGRHYYDYAMELSSLMRVDLSSQWVNEIDENEEELYRNLCEVRELNLRQNLLLNCDALWPMVDKYLPRLTSLNLSNCRMKFSRCPSSVACRVKDLVLIDTNADCSSMEEFFCLFPHLISLHLDLNRFTCLSDALVRQWQCLRSLSLSDNPQLKHWNPSINRLAQLEHLEDLFLNNCSLQHIELPRSGSILSPDHSHRFVVFSR